MKQEARHHCHATENVCSLCVVHVQFAISEVQSKLTCRRNCVFLCSCNCFPQILSSQNKNEIHVDIISVIKDLISFSSFSSPLLAQVQPTTTCNPHPVLVNHWRHPDLLTTFSTTKTKQSAVFTSESYTTMTYEQSKRPAGDHGNFPALSQNATDMKGWSPSVEWSSARSTSAPVLHAYARAVAIPPRQPAYVIPYHCRAAGRNNW